MAMLMFIEILRSENPPTPVWSSLVCLSHPTAPGKPRTMPPTDTPAAAAAGGEVEEDMLSAILDPPFPAMRLMLTLALLKAVLVSGLAEVRGRGYGGGKVAWVDPSLHRHLASPRPRLEPVSRRVRSGIRQRPEIIGSDVGPEQKQGAWKAGFSAQEKY